MDTGKNPIESASPRSGDYLWDRSGEPDPEIRKLESLLGKFRHDLPMPAFPPTVPGQGWRFLRWRLRLVPALTTAAVLAAAIVAATFSFYRARPTPTSLAGWDVSEVQGAPRIERKTLSASQGTNRLGIGQLFETDGKSRASLREDGTGKIQVDPSTRLRLLSMGSGLKRIALERGTIHAFIWAPPGQFVVDTPSAVTVDLGCAYTLQVDDSGAGMVRTSLGWVGFKLNGRESFIPAGAACATRPKIGPGTPYFEGSSANFRAALTRLDFEESTPKQRANDLAVVLNEASKVDSLTLWHLLARVDDQQRVLVYNRLSRFVPPPVAVTKEGILRLDQPMLDQWWNELGFDDISVWRQWERSWAGMTTQIPEK